MQGWESVILAHKFVYFTGPRNYIFLIILTQSLPTSKSLYPLIGI